MNLARKKFDRLPSASTVRNMSDEMLPVAQCQLQKLTETQNLTLQTDETPKVGQSYEAFL